MSNYFNVFEVSFIGLVLFLEAFLNSSRYSFWKRKGPPGVNDWIYDGGETFGEDGESD